MLTFSGFMDKERIMQDGDAFLKAYQVLQSLEETEKKKGVRPQSFAIRVRTFILRLWNSTFRRWQLSLAMVCRRIAVLFASTVRGIDGLRFAKICGGIAALVAFTVLGIGLVHHFISEREERDKSAAIAAYASVGQKDSAAVGHDNPAGAGSASSVTASSVTSTAAASAAATSDQLRANQPASKGASAATEAIQRQQWEAVDKQNLNSLRAYLDKNQQGPYNAEALQRLGALLQEQQAQQAKAKEQNAWNSVDPRAEETIQRFLAQYPNGTHALTAQELLHRLAKQDEARKLALADDNAWSAVSAKDQHSLEQYLNQFPSGRHSDQARQLVSEMPPAAADRETSAREAIAVVATLKKYSDAWNAKDLDHITALQPGLGRRTAKEELSSTRSIVMQIHPTAPPKVEGDRATIECIRKVDKVFADGAEVETPGIKMTYVLVKRGGTWLIADSR
jgi:hypothetical protein